MTQARTMIAYVHAYRDRRHWTSIWTPEIYAAARAVARSAPNVESIITADWGLGTQIFALGGEAVRNRFTDEWPDFTSPTTTTTMLSNNGFKIDA